MRCSALCRGNENGRRQYSSVAKSCEGREWPCADVVRPAAPFDQARHDPGLGLADRAAFGDLDHVAHLVFVALVVGVVLLDFGDDLAVEPRAVTALNQHGDRLGALVADDAADQRAVFLAELCCV